MKIQQCTSAFAMLVSIPFCLLLICSLERDEPRSHSATAADSSAHSDRGCLYTGLPEHQYSAILMPST